MTAWAGGTAEGRQGASREGESPNRTARTVLSPTSMCPSEALLQCSSTSEASSVHSV